MIARALPLAALAAVLVAAPASSTSLPTRTFSMSVSVNNGLADGASTRPSLSASGSEVAFDSVATNLALDTNGLIRDVFVRDAVANATRIVSQAPNGDPGNGTSSHAAIGGDVVAFQSDATNLVLGDGNGLRDVFARNGNGPIVRVSVAAGGGDANGLSSDADISADGRRVVFVSAASNLVPGDTNGQPDVFVRDLRTGETKRFGGTGPSAAPAISPDGRFISFASAASDLVTRDSNDIQDVFLADFETGRVAAVSLSSSGRQQNRSVIEPFPQVSDVSRGGRYVVFDSDATNLVTRDRNRDTDVFMRDTRRRRTVRVSIDKFGFEGDNDSFNPSVSPDGRFVVFQSFATRLAPGDGPREDIFLYDFQRFAPTTISVGARGERKRRESANQLLQRPRVSSDGRIVAFTSTASNLVSGDGNRAEDIFLRVTVPPAARISGLAAVERTSRPTLRLSADDRAVRDFICNLDGVRIECGRNTKLPRIGPGEHILRVRAGGPGMLFHSRPVIKRFRVAL